MSTKRSRLRFAAGAVALLALGCLDIHKPPAVKSNQCTACHGDARRGDDPVIQAAPPYDLNGNSQESARGVGAHQAHLSGSETHAPIACTECHVVPEQLYSPGHLDNPNGARVTFGKLAKTNDSEPVYDSTNTSCNNTYCHQAYSASNNPDWRAPRSSGDACGSCHGLPPAAPHPQSSACFQCHGSVVDKDRHFVNRSLHINGRREVGNLQCNSCHGTDVNGAPPPDLDGNVSTDAAGVGAHELHLTGSSTHAAIACATCHVVPTEVNSPGHIDVTRPADVTFSGLALQSSASPSYDAAGHSCSGTYCHAAATPVWNAPRDSVGACGTCHALPPAFVAGVPISTPGVPNSTRSHPKVADCSRCHGAVIDGELNFVAPERHVNGSPDVAMGCNGCHGSSTSAAPPTDLAGNSAGTSMSVGAHQAHLSGGATSRPVTCGDCHIVPTTVNSPGHIDDWTTAEVTFGGVAVANNRSPSWNRNTGSCADTYCHGPSTSGAVSPIWNDPTVSLNCGSCHGLPPAAPHPQLAQCNLCHTNVRSDFTFIDRTKHVNGSLDF